MGALAFGFFALNGRATLAAAGLDFFAVTPCRLIDTRDPDGPYGGPILQSGTARLFTLTGSAGSCAVPAGAKALSVNMTSVGPTNSGFLTLYPGDEQAPLASNLNFRPGQIRSNNAIVRLAGNGSGTVAVFPFVTGNGQVHLVLDLNGYFQGTACTPSPESCNNVDDDCDGLVDEGLGNIQCGLGACQTTVAACTAGVPGMCVPPAPSTAVDGPTCNGVDDDCDGAIDEDCTLCVKVALTGDDATATANNNATPFRNIQTAINWAAANVSRPRRVCVAAGAACGVTGTYTENVTISNGISVYGNYRSSDFTRCAAGTTTVITPSVATGVLFPNTVTTATGLDGFLVNRANLPTTAAVTVDGATNVLLSNLVIANTPAVTNSYGVNLVNGASALVTRSTISGGTGSTRSVGVRASGSVARVVGNCPGLDAFGRCDDFCTAVSAGPAIRGRFSSSGTGEAYAVLFENAPGSSVESSSLCANDADTGAVIRVTGDGTGVVVRGNNINAFGGALDSHGVWMEDCSGAAPRVTDNNGIFAIGDSMSTRSDAIRAVGDCHPLIDHNVLISGSQEGATAAGVGVYCGPNASALPSHCVVTDNIAIRGSGAGFPPTAVGVHCADGSCLKVAGNSITGRGAQIAIGLLLERTATLVDDNQITGGCGLSSATGIRAVGAAARLQNNVVTGGAPIMSCTTTSAFTGLEVFHENTALELDVHSNDIDGAGQAAMCVGSAIALDVAPGPTPAGQGIYRNNILRAGACNTRFVVVEKSAAADPRIFQNNDLDPYNAPAALYRNEAATNLTTAAQVNALADMTASGNISVDPMFVSYPTNLHLMAGSLCINAGTPTGAPILDFDGQARDATPDIGADESVP